MSLHLQIVTPEKTVFSGGVENVYLPGANGEMGILEDHAGLVTGLQPGELRYLVDGQIKSLAVGSGFAEIGDNKAVILTDMALGESEIDEAAAEAAIKSAEEKLDVGTDSLPPEEAAYLQDLIEKQSMALQFKRRNRG